MRRGYMPKNSTKTTRRSSSKPRYLKTGAFSLIMHKIYIFIPVFVLLVTGLIVKTSLNKQSLQTNACCGVVSFSEVYDENQKIAYFEGKQVPVPKTSSYLSKQEKSQLVLGEATSGEKWIEVDLSEQKLIAHDGDSIFLESLVSTGLPWFPTPVGEFRVWSKIRSTKMEGGEGSTYYNLPNVPYVMFFYNDKTPKMKGYSLHGTYWHNEFGKQKSHGCVNLPIPVAEKLYYWMNPVLDGKHTSIAASDINPGARIVIHE